MKTIAQVLIILATLYLFDSPSVRAQVQDAVFNVIPSLPLTRSVSKAEVSPDGRFVVYIADQETTGVNELYQVALNNPLRNGSNNRVTKLSSPLTTGGDVSDFQISPDSSRIIYLADQETDTKRELYSVAITGGASTKLHGEVEIDRDVVEAVISPDGTRVVYRADHLVDNRFDLFTVPIAGGAITRLSTNVVQANRTVNAFLITPNSGFVVYVSDARQNNVRELFSVPIDGGEITRLNPNPVTGGEISAAGEIAISPNSARVIFIGDLEVNDVFEVFSVGVRGSGFTKLSSSPEPNLFAKLNITADSRQLIFNETLDGESQIVKIAIDGTSDAEIITPEIIGANRFSRPKLSPDGQFLSFTTNLGLHVLSLRTGKVIFIGENNISPVFTADSRQIMFENEGGQSIRLLIRDVTQNSQNRLLAVLPDNDDDGLLLSQSQDGERLIFYIENSQDIFAAQISGVDDGFCFPLIARNGAMATICL